jgi:hypothetical protein
MLGSTRATLPVLHVSNPGQGGSNHYDTTNSVSDLVGFREARDRFRAASIAAFPNAEFEQDDLAVAWLDAAEHIFER